MLQTKNYRDSLILKYNTDSQGNPVSIKINNEKCQVATTNFTIHLHQIPDESHRLEVIAPDGSLMYEVFDVENLGIDNYKVDYAHGIVYFNPNNAGKVVSVTYHGRGVEMIYAGRIALDGNVHGDTLGDLIKDFNNIYDRIQQVKDLLDQLQSDYDKWKDLIYAEQPLLNLQAQIDLLHADSFDHVRWREVSDHSAITANTGAFITNNEDKYLKRY